MTSKHVMFQQDACLERDMVQKPRSRSNQDKSNRPNISKENKRELIRLKREVHELKIHLKHALLENNQLYNKLLSKYNIGSISLDNHEYPQDKIYTESYIQQQQGQGQKLGQDNLTTTGTRSSQQQFQYQENVKDRLINEQQEQIKSQQKIIEKLQIKAQCPPKPSLVNSDIIKDIRFRMRFEKTPFVLVTANKSFGPINIQDLTELSEQVCQKINRRLKQDVVISFHAIKENLFVVHCRSTRYLTDKLGWLACIGSDAIIVSASDCTGLVIEGFPRKANSNNIDTVLKLQKSLNTFNDFKLAFLPVWIGNYEPSTKASLLIHFRDYDLAKHVSTVGLSYDNKQHYPKIHHVSQSHYPLSSFPFNI